MRIPMFAALAAVLLSVVTFSADPRLASAADPYMTASETYYRLDVPNGQASVHVDVEIMGNSAKDLPSIFLYAMPVTKDLVVTQDGTALTTKITSGSDLGAQLSLVEVTLPKALKKGQRIKLKMDYIAPPQTTENISFKPGAVEAVFLGQGPGSFVLLDTPISAETYLDPGCLRAKNQPGELKADGLERYVCGEAAILALEQENKGLLDSCAAMDDRCRQRLLVSPFSAFGQSITDASLRGSITEVMNLGNGPVTVTLRYFRTHETWAQRQFDVARKALPLLEQFFGSNYPHDSITMLQSNHIELWGAAGVAFNEIGTVLLTYDAGGIEDEVTVHELAHQWSHYDTMGSSAATEGIAEFASHVIMRDHFGITTRDWEWQSWGYTDPISTWWVSSTVINPYYWYGKSAAFWEKYTQAIGGQANFTKVMAQIGPSPEEPVDFRWFMDRGEEVSGANLDGLFMEWVFAWTAETAVKERRDSHTKLAELKTHAATAGLTGVPRDLQELMNKWEFKAANNSMTAATDLVNTYLATLTLIDEAGLPRTPAVQDSWPNASLKETAGVIEDIKQALNAIKSADATLAPDALGREQLVEARQKFAEGKLEEAEKLASGSLTKRFNTDTAATLIEVAKKKQAEFKPNLFTRIGLWGKDPDTDLALAEEAMANGDPEAAIGHAKSAYAAWDGAQKDGYARLAISFAALGALATLTWWGLKKIEGKPKEDESTTKKRKVSGHVIGPADDRKGSWKDWENSP